MHGQQNGLDRVGYGRKQRLHRIGLQLMDALQRIDDGRVAITGQIRQAEQTSAQAAIEVMQPIDNSCAGFLGAGRGAFERKSD